MSKRQQKISACEYAMHILSLKAHSEEELAGKLWHKKYSKKEIADAISELKESRYLDDEFYAQTYFENLKKYKTFGYYGIKQKLLQKKISPELIAKVLSEFKVSDELLLAKKLFVKSKNKTPQQKARMLQSRGFRGEVVAALLGHL